MLETALAGRGIQYSTSYIKFITSAEGGYVFTLVCLSICLSVCLSFCSSACPLDK